MNHVMLDLETWGLKPGCALRSIGAVVFDLRGRMTENRIQFYANIDRQSCLDAGLHIDPGTEEWWSKQSIVAREALEANQLPLKEALQRLKLWFAAEANGAYVWSQGSNYDPPLIEAAMAAVGITPPWKFWNVFDTRTIYHISAFDTKSIRREGEHHNALDDANHQATCVQQALAKLSEDMKRRALKENDHVA